MTYSIVARDPDTGELGVAVETHQPSVGALCPFAEAGVGAVAPQSIVEPAYGPRGLAAMRDGIDRKLDPGEPEERNIYEAMEAGKQVNRIPMTFGDALDALEADDVVKEALPGDMYRVFMHYKRDEWERYCATVSDWDVEEYLDVLP